MVLPSVDEIPKNEEKAEIKENENSEEKEKKEEIIEKPPAPQGHGQQIVDTYIAKSGAPKDGSGP